MGLWGMATRRFEQCGKVLSGRLLLEINAAHAGRTFRSDGILKRRRIKALYHGWSRRRRYVARDARRAVEWARDERRAVEWARAARPARHGQIYFCCCCFTKTFIFIHDDNWQAPHACSPWRSTKSQPQHGAFCQLPPRKARGGAGGCASAPTSSWSVVKLSRTTPVNVSISQPTSGAPSIRCRQCDITLALPVTARVSLLWVASLKKLTRQGRWRSVVRICSIRSHRDLVHRSFFHPGVSRVDQYLGIPSRHARASRRNWRRHVRQLALYHGRYDRQQYWPEHLLCFQYANERVGGRSTPRW